MCGNYNNQLDVGMEVAVISWRGRMTRYTYVRKISAAPEMCKRWHSLTPSHGRRSSRPIEATVRLAYDVGRVANLLTSVPAITRVALHRRWV